jgi:hypothetical protein
MPVTKVTNIIVPAVFSPYIIERTTELADVIQSQAVERDEELDRQCNAGGSVIDVPYFKEITGDSALIDENTPTVPDPINTGADKAALLNRTKAWGGSVLAKWASGTDPVGVIGNMVAGFWARDLKRIVLKILDGLFDGVNGVLRTSHRVNIYSDVASPAASTQLTGSTFVDGTLRLGDHSPDIVAVLMHGDVEGALRKQELIQYVQPANAIGKRIPMFQDRTVMVSDDCPKVTGTNTPAYTTFLFGRGAFAHGIKTDDPEDASEVDRVGLAHETHLITRRRFVLHPRGVKWIGNAVAAAGPTNAELSTGTNWSKVYSDKNIRIVAIRHNIAV